MGILFFIEKQNKSGKALGEKRCSFVFHVFTENKILYIFFTSGGFHSDPSSKQCKDAIHSPQWNQAPAKMKGTCQHLTWKKNKKKTTNFQ